MINRLWNALMRKQKYQKKETLELYYEGISGKKYHRNFYKAINGFIIERVNDKIVEIEKHKEVENA